MNIMRTSFDRIIFFTLALLLVQNVSSQCQISTNATSNSITCGSCVTLSAFGNGTGNIAFSEDFNSGAPVGWQFTQSAQFNNPCSPNGVDGTTHLWMGPGSINPRDMVTVTLDLSLGGSICFDMLFAEQGEASPCEGPDEPQEGVYLEYSIDGGNTWVTINYFDPNGGNDPQLTNWNNWCFVLPAGAATPSTMIRWHQDDVTDDIYDHWGIDNVEITLNDPNFGITWLHDNFEYGLGVAGGANPTPVCPTQTTTYVAQVSDGISTCLDSVTITVLEPVIILTAGDDQTICSGECAELNGNGYHLVSPASTPTFENNEFGIVSGGSASVNINVQGLNTTALVDGSITQICIAGFEMTGGVSPCFDFNGCPCNGATIGFGEQCDLNTGSFEVTLTSPGGCEIVLVPAGVSATGYVNTCFIPVGGTPFGPGFPNGGTWDPSEPISNLNGCDPNGVWTLNFTGPGGLSIGFGSLNGWSISFDDPEVTEPVDFVWSPTTNMNGSDTFSPDVCPTSSTTYVLTATDLAGCTSLSDSVTITIENCCDLQIITVDVVPPSCTLADGSITISALQGQTTGVVYSINGGPPQSSPTFTGLGAGQYTIVVNDDNGCPVTRVIDLQSGDGPEIVSVDTTPSDCSAATGSITINATGDDLEYSLDGGTFQQSEILTNVANGTYTVVVRDGAGCITTTTAVVASPSAPIPIISGPGTGCFGDVLIIGTTETFDSYVWSTGSNTSTTNVSTSGPVTVTVTDAQGCSGTSAPFDVLLEGPTAVFTTSPTSPQLPGTTVSVFDASTAVGSPITGWQWNFGDGGSASSPDTAWTYDVAGQYVITLVVTTANGCVDTVSTVYIVRPADIIVPNVFSPNNDGSNDAFVIDNIEFFRNELTIFNRWGNVVHAQKDYRNQWRGKDLPDGTYFYVLLLEDGREFTGHVTLLR
jgi:gliding motility-associated-like protein